MAPPQWVYQVDNFDPPPDEELICSICRAVFCEPSQCPCLHVFCRGCIGKWLTSNSTCPVCRKRVQSKNLQDVVPIVKNMIMKLTLHCHNLKNGCQDILPLEACESHVRTCIYELLPCKNRPCRKVILRRDIVVHESSECEYRYVKCEMCHLKISTVTPLDHNCVKELTEAVKKKRAILKKRNRTIEEQQAEIKRLKQAAKDRENNNSDSSYSVDIYTSGTEISTDEDDSSADYVINWTAGASDISLELEGTLSDIDEREINIAIERSINDSSVIVLNSSRESNGIQISSDCIEIPRASSNSDPGTSSSNVTQSVSSALETSSIVEEEESPPRRPNKRRHAPQLQMSDESGNEEDGNDEWWRPTIDTDSSRHAAESSFTSSPAGQSTSSTSSGPTVKTSNRKKYRLGSSPEVASAMGGPSVEAVDFSEASVCQLGIGGTFERTMALLQRYNIDDSDTEWIPEEKILNSDTSADSSDKSDADSSDKSDDGNADDSSLSSGDDSDLYVPPVSLLLRRNLCETSDEDPDWIPK